jgi:hypothetical protein
MKMLKVISLGSWEKLKGLKKFMGKTNSLYSLLIKIHKMLSMIT